MHVVGSVFLGLMSGLGHDHHTALGANSKTLSLSPAGRTEELSRYLHVQVHCAGLNLCPSWRTSSKT